jgi:hypothetical protein
MAAKEDILEQIVEEYLLHAGYFVRHNLKFRPLPDDPGFKSKEHSNHSDIDVIGWHPKKLGIDKLVVVSCKSWQQGFNPSKQINAAEKGKKLGGRDAWKSSRELWKEIWANAFIRKIKETTGTSKFTYITAVTHVVGDRSIWEQNPKFRKILQGNPIKIIDLTEMMKDISPQLSTTVAETEVGRTLQLFKAAGILNIQGSN